LAVDVGLNLQNISLQEGYEVFVIKESLDNENRDNQWLEGLNIPKENIYELKRHFLSDWMKSSNGLIEKIKYRISVLILKVIEKGTIFDACVGLKKSYTDLLNKVIKAHQIDRMVVSGAPFNLLYYTALVIKEQNKYYFFS
jgi:hypothetical protein